MVDFLTYSRDLMANEQMTVAKSLLVAGSYAKLHGYDDGGAEDALGHVVGWEHTAKVLPKLIAFWNAPSPQTFSAAVEKLSKSAKWIGTVSDTMSSFMNEIKITAQVASISTNFMKGVDELWNLHARVTEAPVDDSQWMRISHAVTEATMRFFTVVCNCFKIAASVFGQVLNKEAVLLTSAAALTARFASFTFEHELAAV
ncbi:MAG: hypothetical protein SP1CHLAM54_16570 [Chlamydiia bacterium]|nr:hypothetical protein [Chlamydiia bacterium]MCH9616546.1 hypothetical protein [Chlamydiia bacterium]MCH9629276.1 hypothetical protein [Chlamydiia bacterium]